MVCALLEATDDLFGVVWGVDHAVPEDGAGVDGGGGGGDTAPRCGGVS